MKSLLSSKINKYEVIVILTILIFNLLIFNKYFPVTEGWWETYGYLINNGLSPEKDFSTVFPSLFIYYNSIILNTFGIDFYSFRLLGVFIFLLQCILLTYYLKDYFSSISVSIGVLLTTFLYISMPIYIAKDYHTYVYIFELLTLILFNKSMKYEDIKKYFYFSLSLISLSILFLIKQNIGLLLLTVLPILILMISNSKKEVVIRILLFTVFFIFLLFSLNFAQIFDNDAKGSLVHVAFRFLTEYDNRKIIMSAFILTFLLIILKQIFSIKLNKLFFSIEKLNNDFQLYSIEKKGIILLFLFFCFLSIFSFFINNIIVISFVVVMYLIYITFLNKRYINFLDKKCSSSLVFFLVLIYANTQTTTFDYGGLLIIIAFSICVLTEYLNYFKINRLLFFISFMYISIIGIVKLEIPYGWWNNVQSPIKDAKYETNFENMDGIMVDIYMKDIYNYLDIYIQKNSINKYDVYCYNIPLLYLLTEHLPPYKMVTHWFDVSRTSDLQEEFESFNKELPKNIIINQPTSSAFFKHKQLKGVEKLEQEKFLSKMNKLVEENKYDFISSLSIPTKILYDEKQNNLKIRYSMILQNKKYLNMSIDNFNRQFQKDFTVEKIFRNNKLIYNQQNKKKDLPLKTGDILTLSGKYKTLFEKTGEIGIPNFKNSLWNSINIYKRK